MNKLALLALNKKLGGGGSTELSPFDDFIEGNTTEISSGASKIASNAFYYWRTPTSANFPNATEIGELAFNSCSELTSVNIPNATKIGRHAFSNCSSLTSVNCPKVTQIGVSGFGSCYSLTSVNCPKVTQIDDSGFSNCRSLTSVDFPNVEYINYAVFSSCFLLTSVNFHNEIKINSSAFSGCYSLKSVILRSETMCTLYHTSAFNNCCYILGEVHKTYNPTGAKDGYFYVPKALLSDDDATKDYRRATNWSTFATQFRALEDYTVDGTITGELDPNKI